MFVLPKTTFSSSICFWLQAAVGIFFGLWLSKVVKTWCQKQLKFWRLASKLPGPPALPLIGNALLFVCSPDEILDRVIELAKGYDTRLRFWLGPKLVVALKEPRDIDIILNSSKATYKDPVYRFFEQFVGRGLITDSGPKHRAHRKVIVPMLNAKVLDVYVEYFDSRSRSCANDLEKLVDTGEFDVSPFMEHCTMNIILDTIMGTPGTVELGGHRELTQWAMRMDQLVHARMMKLWLHPDWIFARTEYGKQQTAGLKVIHKFTESIIARKKEEHYALENRSIVTNRPRLMLLEQLIDHAEKTNLMDDIQLRDEIYTIILASQDTTATISSFVFVMLGMHPEIQDKVRTELNEVLGDRNVTTQSLPGLRYLENVIKETLRLFPVAPFMVRQLRGEVDLDTCTLPEGCSVLLAPYFTHRDPKNWENPDKFDPDRFSPENSIGRHSYAYLPFSGGFRGCIGQKYAMMCMKTVVANIVRRYRLTCSSSWTNSN